MILGIGTDLILIDRVKSTYERLGQRFAKRILTEFEFNIFINDKKECSNWLAKRWAAKEAVGKALGTGIGQGVSWQHIEIKNDSLNKPFLTISETALEIAQNLAGPEAIIRTHISLTDDPPYAQAFIVIEAC